MLAGQERLQAGEPAGRHGGGAAALGGAREHRFRRGAGGLQEIGADPADPGFGLRQAEFRRMGRLIQGPGSVASGQTVSSSAPSTTRSKVSSRASSRPRISTRGCAPPSRPRLPRRLGAAAPAMAASKSAGQAAGESGPSGAMAGPSPAR